jgi:hypothetical protein
MDSKINAKDNAKIEEVKDDLDRLAQQHALVSTNHDTTENSQHDIYVLFSI